MTHVPSAVLSSSAALFTPQLQPRYQSVNNPLTLLSQSTAVTASGQIWQGLAGSGSSDLPLSFDAAILSFQNLGYEDMSISQAELQSIAKLPDRQQAADLDMLEALAQHGDRDGFLSLVHHIDWATCAAAELSRTIDLALRLDLIASAVDLTQLGMRHFPGDRRLAQAARVLAPSAIRIAPSNQPGGLQASQDWLYAHASPYRGQWIVVRAGQLLGAAPELAQLRELIARENDPATTIITRVW